MWGVPIDHEYFKTTNKAQWLWYFYNSIEDKEEEFLDSRALLEYHAGFIEPALVSKVRSERLSREYSDGEGVIGTNDEHAFGESVKQIFGRELTAPTGSDKTITDAEVHHFSDVAERIKEYEQQQAELRKENVPYNYKHWTEFDLG